MTLEFDDRKKTGSTKNIGKILPSGLERKQKLGNFDVFYDA